MSSPDPSSDQWPEWVRYALSAVAGVGLTIVAVTRKFASVCRDASDAKQGFDDHSPRLQRVESDVALHAQALRQQGLTLEEVRLDVKELLNRVR